jgi:hypothetical protein
MRIRGNLSMPERVREQKTFGKHLFINVVRLLAGEIHFFLKTHRHGRGVSGSNLRQLYS